MGKKKGGETAGGGFFMVDMNEIDRLYMDDCGPEAMAAYLVLCSGVNFVDDLRCSTHGANSVWQRAGLESRHQAETEIKWLCEHEYIRKPLADDPLKVGPAWVRWIIQAGNGESDVPISRQFVDGTPNSTRTPVARLLADVMNGDFPRRQAVKDALLLYVAFSRELDYGHKAGVDPRIWNETLPVVPTADSDWSDWTPRRSVETGYALVAVKKKGEVYGGAEFIRATTGLRASTPSESVSRFFHATHQLHQLGLVYRVVVLWMGKPTDSSTSDEAKPVATLYVNDEWARPCDPSIQFDVNRAIQRVEGEEFEFDTDGSLLEQFKEGYRYLVRRGSESKTTVVRQLRVRYWAAAPSIVQGRLKEKERTEHWKQILSKL